jgi:hypothetical protein
VGKTSLLNYLSDPEVAAQRGLDPQKFLLCKIDCQSLGDFTPHQFWRRLLRGVARLTAGPLQSFIEQLQAQDEIGYEDVQDLLDELEDAGKVLVAILDEFECTIQTHTEAAEQRTRHFLGMLGALGRRAPRVFTMIIATEAPVAKLDSDMELWRGSPFATVFISQELPPFSREEADVLFDQALGDTGLDFSVREREFLYRQTGGHPASLQRAAAAMFEAKRRGLTGRAVRDAVLSAITDSRGNRSAGASGQSGLWVDEATGVVWVDGNRVENLSAKEYALLLYLYQNAGRVCSKDEIWKTVWPEYEEGITDYPIQKAVSRLRRKIEPAPARPRYILTVRGRGYRLVK